jgi:translation elongation factor EF-1alpha
MSLSEGMVLCRGPPLPKLCRRFRATILTMSTLSPPIIPGSSFELYLHGEEVLCQITKLYRMTVTPSSVDDHRSGSNSHTSRSGPNSTNTVKLPKCVPGGRCASVRIDVMKRICIEPFKVCGALGRFALRAKGKTCAVGICEKVSDKFL